MVRYQTPAMDVLSDDTGGVLLVIPPAPPIYHVEVGLLKWGPADTADGYIVEHLVGPRWTELKTVGNVLESADAGITAPGYYRVRGFNLAGNGLPSLVMFLESEDSSS